MKKLLYIVCIFASLLSFSCASSGNLIPGQNKVKLQNIYSEYYNIAEAYFNLKNYSKALTYYNLCLENQSLHNNAYYKSGLCYIYTKKWDEALQIFSELYKNDAENASLKSTFAYINFMKDDKEKAISLYEELYSQYPKNMEYLENLIAVYIAKEDNSMVEEKLAVLKEKFPSSTKISKIEEYLQKLNKENQEETSSAQ